jgi:hypothetical protein
MPFIAKANGTRFVHARQACQNEDSTGYTCIDCGERMVLVRGTARVPHCQDVLARRERAVHFRHVRDDNEASCSGGESDKHKLAKTLLASNLDKWTFTVRCECNRMISMRFKGTPVEEQAIGTRVLDVGILDSQGKIVGGIEVHHTHAVDREKELDLEKHKLRWVEVEAEDVIATFSRTDFDTEGNTPVMRIETINSSSYIDCSSCQKWRLDNERHLEATEGNERIVRPKVIIRNGQVVAMRSGFIETKNTSKKHLGMFFSDILRIDPSYICFFASAPNGFKGRLDDPRVQTCKWLLWDRCHRCGKPDVYPSDEYCKDCLVVIKRR